MTKIIRRLPKYIIITCLVICMTGCGQAKEKDNTEENLKESVSQNVYEKDTQDSVSQNDHEQDQQASVSQNTDDGKLHVRVHNPYFYEKEVTNLDIKLEYCEGDVAIWRTGKSTMRLVKNYENGDLFKLSVAHERNIQDYFGEERLNIYFYVTNDKIYRVPSYINRDGEEIPVYEDDFVIAYLDTDDKVISESELVYCKENFENKVELENVVIGTESDGGRYDRTEWNKDGSIYYYEAFSWNEIDKLSWFSSEYGTGADGLYIDVIGDADVEQTDQGEYFTKENQTEINITEEIKNGKFEYLNDDERSRRIIRNVYEALKSRGDLSWVQRDLNNDGIDDLLMCDNDGFWEGSKVVVGIFACEKDHADCIRWDAEDWNVFYFVGQNGRLAKYSQSSSVWDMVIYTPISYEEDWTRVWEYTLEFYNGTGIDGEDLERWKSTYGPEMEEPGKYYVKHHADGTREFLTKEKFNEILMEDMGITYDEDD